MAMNPIDHPMGGGQGKQRGGDGIIRLSPWGNWRKGSNATPAQAERFFHH